MASGDSLAGNETAANHFFTLPELQANQQAAGSSIHPADTLTVACHVGSKRKDTVRVRVVKPSMNSASK